MKSEKAFDYPTMEGPVIYRIRVRGRLNADLSDRLEGMHIENLQRNDGKAESVLGEVFSARLRWPVFSTSYSNCIFR